MFRRTVVALSQNSKRTVVRDPRKKRVPVVRQDETAASEIEPVHTTTQSSRQPLLFEPNSQNQQVSSKTTKPISRCQSFESWGVASHPEHPPIPVIEAALLTPTAMSLVAPATAQLLVARAVPIQG